MSSSRAGERTSSKGAAGRVAAVHHQTRRGLIQAGLFTVAAVVAVVVPHDTGPWLPVHLFVLGGLLTAISTTTQMLAVTWSAAPPAPAGIATAQRLLLGAGTIAIAVGRESQTTHLIEIGGAAVVIAIAAMIPILIAIRRSAVTARFAPAIDGYVLAMLLGTVGVSVAVVLATDRASDHWFELREVHLTLNIFGLVGLVAAATLPYFAATMARRKMSPRATPSAMRATVAVLAVATVVAAIGQGLPARPMTSVALGAYAGGLVVIATMLPIYGRRQAAWAGPRLIQFGCGIIWWVAMTVTLAGIAWNGGDDGAALRALVVGGFAQILLASLAYLGPVLRGGGHEQLTEGFAITSAWPSLIAGNVAALGALMEWRIVLTIALLVWLIDSGVRAVRLVVARSSPRE